MTVRPMRPGELRDTALIITAWRRPDYLRHALASWGRVAEIGVLGRVTVALGRSDVEVAQRAVIEQFRQDVRPAEIRLDSPGSEDVPGEHRPLGEAVLSALRDHSIKYVICTAEDVAVSGDVLRYFLWARQFRSAVCVCAHNELGQGWHEWYDDSAASQTEVRIGHYFNPWCWGFTRQAWYNVIGVSWDWNATSGPNDKERGWDWQMHRVTRTAKAVSPLASRALNLGRDGGVYADPGDYHKTIARSFRTDRGLVEYRLVP